MKIAYITIKFPVWSETFAVGDMATCHQLGHDIEIFSLRGTSIVDNAFYSHSFNAIKNLAHAPNLWTRAKGILNILFYLPTFIKWLLWLTKTEKNRVAMLKCIILSPQIFYLWRELKDKKFDVIHLFWGHYTSALAWLIKETYDVDVLSMFLGAYDLEQSLDISSEMGQRSDIVWTHAHYNRVQLEKMNIPADKINVSHRGLDFNDVPINIKKKNKFRIVTSGRLTKDKCFSDVIYVFKKVKNQFPDSELVIIGTGEELGHLKRLAKELNIEESVLFRGRVQRVEVLDEMARSNVFLFMSRYEGDRLPNVVKEAMASKCASVVSKTHGIEELVENDKTGYIVEMGAVDEASKIVCDLFLDQEKMERIGQSAMVNVKENFSIKSSIEKYTAKWSELLKDK